MNSQRFVICIFYLSSHDLIGKCFSFYHPLIIYLPSHLTWQIFVFHRVKIFQSISFAFEFHLSLVDLLGVVNMKHCRLIVLK